MTRGDAADGRVVGSRAAGPGDGGNMENRATVSGSRRAAWAGLAPSERDPGGLVGPERRGVEDRIWRRGGEMDGRGDRDGV